MQLTKHHGLGNDFLVVLDLDGTRSVSLQHAVALCDRHTGIGADGLVRVTAGTDGADVTMRLFNADGSVAEMSGNGIRCLAQAVFQAGLATPPVLRVATDAGLRTVTLLERLDTHTHRLSVEMGQAKVGDAEPEWAGGDVLRAVRVDMGNPHVVLLWGADELPATDELIAIGSRIDAATAGGANVELIRPRGSGDGIDMVVYERGVGPTQACGTGACAVAAAAHEWKLVGEQGTVHMPGGPLDVTLGDPVLLTGDATSVAVIDAPWP
ncbi:MAG: diaminopimelate epimerase [Acidimicrobiales bacterium]